MKKSPVIATLDFVKAEVVMNEPCINKQCGAYKKDGEYNCNHILLEDPLTCRVYIPAKTKSKKKARE
ncbi:MAG: hypothetical protein V3U75_01450 [Methylococcaceae bacterium]